MNFKSVSDPISPTRSPEPKPMTAAGSDSAAPSTSGHPAIVSRAMKPWPGLVGRQPKLAPHITTAITTRMTTPRRQLPDVVECRASLFSFGWLTLSSDELADTPEVPTTARRVRSGVRCSVSHRFASTGWVACTRTSCSRWGSTVIRTPDSRCLRRSRHRSRRLSQRTTPSEAATRECRQQQPPSAESKAETSSFLLPFLTMEMSLRSEQKIERSPTWFQSVRGCRSRQAERPSAPSPVLGERFDSRLGRRPGRESAGAESAGATGGCGAPAGPSPGLHPPRP